MKSRYLISLVLVLPFISCQEDPIAEVDPQYPGVHQALWPYYQLFEEAAAERGIHVDLAAEGITGDIDQIHEGSVIGRCQYGGYTANHITIDSDFWGRSGHLGREMVVFHELGHCYLGRGHREDAFRSGSCVSIMRSGTCCCRDGYRTTTREYYIDELFRVD